MRTTGKSKVGNAIKSMRVVLTVTILLVAFVMLYFHFSNKEADDNEDVKNSDVVEKLLSVDLEKNYPTNVREVVLEFTEIQKCYYNENVSEDQLERLAKRATLLFDEELLSVNPFDEYYADLKKEINSFKKKEKTITRVIVDKNSEANTVTSPEDGTKIASIKVTYYCRENANTTRIVETYILRKDEAGNWKIYGWGVMDEEK